jgi:hypothetical protein
MIDLRDQLCGAVRDREAARAAIREEWRYARQSGVVDLDELKEQRDALQEADRAIMGGRRNESHLGDSWRWLTGKRFDPKICFTAKLKPLPIASALPRDPGPPGAKYRDVGKWEEKLRASTVYQALWSDDHEADRNLFLSGLSQLLPRGAFWGAILDRLKEREEIRDACIATYMVLIRRGRLPEDMAAKLRELVDSSRSAPHLGVWTPGDDGYDYSALAAWSNPESLDHFREFILARTQVPHGEAVWGKDLDAKPHWLRYLADERAALSRYQTLLLLAAKKGYVPTEEDCEIVGLDLRPADDQSSPVCRQRPEEAVETASAEHDDE